MIRDSAQRINVIANFLKALPATEAGDPLTTSTSPTDSMDPTSAQGVFGYTDEEAILIRSVFTDLQALNAALAPILAKASRLTGLE